MTLKVCGYAALHGLKVGFYGGTEKNVALLLSELARRYSGPNIVYSYSPPFRKLTLEEDAQARDRKLRGADIVRRAAMSETGAVEAEHRGLPVAGGRA